MYVFFQMSATIQARAEHVTLLPLADMEDETGKTHILSHLYGLDARKAKCYRPEDRHRLLGVIEASYGTCTAFNESVHRVVQTVIDNERRTTIRVIDEVPTEDQVQEEHSVTRRNTKLHSLNGTTLAPLGQTSLMPLVTMLRVRSWRLFAARPGDKALIEPVEVEVEDVKAGAHSSEK
jgi:hypothetical protein